jgi:hypothetical protein
MGGAGRGRGAGPGGIPSPAQIQAMRVRGNIHIQGTYLTLGETEDDATWNASTDATDATKRWYGSYDEEHDGWWRGRRNAEHGRDAKCVC